MHFAALIVFIIGTSMVANGQVCSNGSQSVSVDGQSFCVDAPICSGSTNTGNCPGPVDELLPYGSYCGLVSNGVYGCKANAMLEATAMLASGEEESLFLTACSPTTDGYCPGPQSGLEFGSHCEKGKDGKYSCVANALPAAESIMKASANTKNDEVIECPVDMIPVNVQNAGTYCAAEPICVANVYNGNCPKKQGNLTVNARCEVVNTGVYGCIV